MKKERGRKAERNREHRFADEAEIVDTFPRPSFSSLLFCCYSIKIGRLSCFFARMKREDRVSESGEGNRER